MTELKLSDLENRPTSDLLAKVHSLSYEESEWEVRDLHVAALELRGDDETFEAARAWSVSNDAIERELAADLLNQFGVQVDGADGSVSFVEVERTVPILEKLAGDPEPAVIASAVHGLGWNNAYDVILARSELAKHASSNVRFAIACGLNGADSKAAIDILVALSSDEDDDVRDRANWVLGVCCNLDTPEIRDALLKNLDDPQIDTRSEAMIGLARRKDSRVIPHINRAFLDKPVNYLVVEAAAHLAAQELVVPLEALLSRSDVDWDLVKQALNRCQGISDPENDKFWKDYSVMIVPAWVSNDTRS